jgi:hypothetical protein
LKIKRLEREQEGLIDISPLDRNSLTFADFNPEAFVQKDMELSLTIRNLNIQLEVTRKRFEYLFGKNLIMGSTRYDIDARYDRASKAGYGTKSAGEIFTQNAKRQAHPSMNPNGISFRNPEILKFILIQFLLFWDWM